LTTTINGGIYSAYGVVKTKGDPKGVRGCLKVRSDARKNRERLIEVTIELVIEIGGEPARDAVAERAGVGIATLYRHFPDQQSLLHAAVRHVLERTISAGERLVETIPDGHDLLRQYMHMALESGIGVVSIIRPLLENKNWPDLHARASDLMTSIVGQVLQGGCARADLTERDIVFALIRFARPLPVGLPPTEERALAHRHLDYFIDGVCNDKRRHRRGT
jgi:AcrR family transcriptional regulator